MTTAIDETELLDRVSSTLRDAGAPAATTLSELQGGRSSITYLTTLEDGQRTVVKLAPPGLAPVKNRDVLRQARLLRALHTVDGIRVPGVLAEHVGDPPEVPPLFVMEYAPGDSDEPLGQRADPPPDTETTRQRGLAAAEMLAALQRVSPGDVGLGDEPVILPEDEIHRWSRVFETVTEELQVGATDVRDRLLKAMPDPMPSVLTHGDWRLGNMLSEGAYIHAVIDWEIWSVSDPRLDLAWFLLMADPARPNATSPAGVTGLPSPRELADHWASASGMTLTGLDWFGALVRYKQAAIGALIAKNRVKAHGKEDDISRMMASQTAPLLAQAIEQLHG